MYGALVWFGCYRHSIQGGNYTCTCTHVHVHVQPVHVHVYVFTYILYNEIVRLSIDTVCVYICMCVLVYI